MNFFNMNFAFDNRTKAVIILFALIIGFGIWVVASAFLPRSKRKARQTIEAFNKRGKEKSDGRQFEGGLSSAARKISKYIRLTELDHSEMSKALQITGSAYTPEEYMGLIYVSAAIFALIGVLMCLLGLISHINAFYFIGIAGVIFGIVYGIFLKKSLMKNKATIIEGVDNELPRFVAFVATALQKQNTSIISLLERYVPKNSQFAGELNQTIADAKTSNFTAAMARWDQRINSDRLKRVVRGLINANNGDDVRVYFAMLERDFTSYEIALLKQDVKKIPAKMRLPKMLMYSSVVLSLFFPILMQVLESFQEFFTKVG